jgi:TorA maturation chaperone TorD
VPDYCDRVAEEAETDYYCEIAALTRKFVEQEYDGFQ